MCRLEDVNLVSPIWRPPQRLFVEKRVVAIAIAVSVRCGCVVVWLCGCGLGWFLEDQIRDLQFDEMVYCNVLLYNGTLIWIILLFGPPKNHLIYYTVDRLNKKIK